MSYRNALKKIKPKLYPMNSIQVGNIKNCVKYFHYRVKDEHQTSAFILILSGIGIIKEIRELEIGESFSSL